MATLAAERQVQGGVNVSPGAAAVPGERDLAWFERLYGETVDSVYRFALMLTHEPSAAEDVAAETYLRAWRSRNAYSGRGPAHAWLFTIAHHCAVDGFRNQRGEVDVASINEPEDPSSDVLRPMLSESDVAIVREAIAKLTREQQQVVFLRFYEELSHKVVAHRLGRSPNAVRAIQFRALSRLRKLLAGDIDD